MTSMREKIARAAHDAQWDEPFPNEGSIAHAMAMQVADAVLDALMEPTEGMIAHAEALSDFVLSEGFDNSSEGRRAEFRGAFISAIRAAKEGK